MNAPNKIHIKFSPGDDYLDPTPEFLIKLMSDINNYNGYYQTLSNPVIDQNYIYFDYAHSEMWDDSGYTQGLISGYLMANGFQIR